MQSPYNIQDTYLMKEVYHSYFDLSLSLFNILIFFHDVFSKSNFDSLKNCIKILLVLTTMFFTYLFLERGRGGEKKGREILTYERNITRLLLTPPQPGA